MSLEDMASIKKVDFGQWKVSDSMYLLSSTVPFSFFFILSSALISFPDFFADQGHLLRLSALPRRFGGSSGPDLLGSGSGHLRRSHFARLVGPRGRPRPCSGALPARPRRRASPPDCAEAADEGGAHCGIRRSAVRDGSCLYKKAERSFRILRSSGVDGIVLNKHTSMQRGKREKEGRFLALWSIARDRKLSIAMFVEGEDSQIFYSSQEFIDIVMSGSNGK